MEDRDRIAADGAPDMAAVVDASGVVSDLSASLGELLRLDVSDQTLLWELVHPDEVARVRAAVSSAFHRDGAVPLAFRVLDGGGRWRALDATLQRQPTVPPTLTVAIAEAAPRESAGARQPRANRVPDAFEAADPVDGGAVDDVGDLLAVIAGASSRLLEQLPHDSPFRADAATISTSAERAASIVRQILSFGRPQDERMTELDMGQTIDEVRPQIVRLLGERVALGLERAPDLWTVRAHRDAIEQVFLTLAVNARAAMPRGGRVTIAVSNWSRRKLAAEGLPSHAAMVVAAITDTGDGMDAAAQARAFDPFFTSDGPAAVSGLGLATVRAVVEDNGGWVQLRSTPGSGTTVLVGLPRVNGQEAEIDEPVVQGHTMLLVEDEAGVRELVRDMLLEAGYEVLEASTPSEAERINRSRTEPIALLLTDIVMPEMSGVELSGRLRRERPGLRVMYMSGFPNPGLSDGAMEPADAQFLAKPFTRQALLSAVQRAVAGETR